MSNQITVLIVKQPWAWLIVNGHKTVENRTWRVNDRGPVLIHAGKSFDYDSLWFMSEQRETLPAGRAVIERFGITGDNEPRITKGREIMGALVGFAWLTRTDSGASSNPWAEKGLYHWHMERGRELAVPEPMAGRLGLFQYHWKETAEFRTWRDECAEEFGHCLTHDDHIVFNALEELEHCYYFKDKTELEKKQKEAKEKWEDDQNYAREIIEIMNTWRDRVNPIPLDFAIEAIKNTWRLK